MEVSQIYIYPIKSLKGIALEKSMVDFVGLKYDRRWVLTDKDNKFISQRTHPKMASIDVEITELGLKVSFETSILIPFQYQNHSEEIISIWDDKIVAHGLGKKYNDWFSNALNFECKLFFQPENSIRKVDPEYAITKNEITNFSDAYPILVISEESLMALNDLCPENVEMNNFRPNIVIKGGKAFEEDLIKEFKINDAVLYGVKPCGRCIMINYDEKNKQFNKEPLKTLSTFRKFGNKVLFGQNVVVHKMGEISIGQKLVF